MRLTGPLARLLMRGLAALLLVPAMAAHGATADITRWPADQAVNVNPDTPLRIVFPSEPVLGNQGRIKVFDAADGRLVDMLDLSIPPGPRNSRTRQPYERLRYAATPGAKAIAGPEPDGYQRKYIGGDTAADAYHFYPVLMDGRTATIALHRPLAYGKTYHVQIDAEVFSTEGAAFHGLAGKAAWTFSTKQVPPPQQTRQLIVAADGSGDFSTVQAAIDFIPERDHRVTILIRNGIYEEIVHLRNKSNISFVGENREEAVIRYANNGVFNARPEGPDMAEMVRKFHNRRAVFAATRANGIHIANLTLQSMGDKPAQAEALLILGEQAIVSHVTIDGSGDALQAVGSVYVTDSRIQGYGDNVLGSGAVFFNRCDMVSSFGPHVWVRNTAGNRGNVFKDCRFRTTGGAQTVFARAPRNGTIDYPHAEVVLLNSRIEGIRPEGWGAVGSDTSNIHYWEYNSTDASSGKAADVSGRAPYSRQLVYPRDAQIIDNYSQASFVLKGWTPAMAPFIVAQPASATARQGDSVRFSVQAAGLPPAAYQWLKDGVALAGETLPELTLRNAARASGGDYAVVVSNESGAVTSLPARLVVD